MVAKLSLVECMAVVEDPRVDRTKAHDLQDILVLSVLAVLCGADGWEDEAFSAWVSVLNFGRDGLNVIAIDGKSLRRSHDKKSFKSMLRSVAAWSVENRVGGDYVLAIKDDHPTLHKAMSEHLIKSTRKNVSKAGCDITIRDGKECSETRYYLSSLPVNCLAAIIEDAVALGLCRPILNAKLPIWVKAIFD